MNLTTKISVVLMLILMSCHLPVECDSGEWSYRYWAGSYPPKDIIIKNGSYKQSPHWTLEYTLYLELIPSKEYWDGSLEYNNCIIDTTNSWKIPDDAPKWFTPSKECIKWKTPESGYNPSRFIKDPLNKTFYIYIQQF